MPAQILLIQKTDFAGYVKIATNLPDADLNPKIYEAQNFDVRPLLGDAFWFDLLDKYSNMSTTGLTAAYSAILSGSPYVASPFTAGQDGIKPIVVYFTAAKLIKGLDIHITPTGIMKKNNEYSDHVDTKAINLKATEYENMAYKYWDDLRRYIQAKGKTIYPLFQEFNSCITQQSAGISPRIYGISGKNLNEYR